MPEKSHDPFEMVREARAPWLWTNWTLVALGTWLATSPVVFGGDDRAMLWNDAVSGIVLAVAAALAILPRFDFWGRWTACLVGVWLQAAPLFFWAKDAAAYLNDTLVGALAIALTVLVPMMPGMAHHRAMMKPGPEVPPGWSYNPSTWHQRAPLIALGLAGWLVSRALAAVQLGYVEAAWEPFFGDGTARVLHSEVSRSWPVSDAGFGALAYTIETLMGFMGGRTRWRTMPWMVTFFGILVIPLGITHVVLVTLQPVVVGAWCTLCLAAALLMLAMVPLAVDEVVAMLQFLRAARRDGKSVWRTFWVGDTIRGGSDDSRTPRYGAPLSRSIAPMFWGVTAPWSLVVSAACGLWLLFAPWALGTSGAAADSDHLTGAVVVTIAVVAMAEVVRAGRWLNVLAGAWVALAPWLLPGAPSVARGAALGIGAALILLSLPRGTVRERYGRWDRCVI